MCTGGATYYIDQAVFGENHLQHYPPCASDAAIQCLVHFDDLGYLWQEPGIGDSARGQSSVKICDPPTFFSPSPFSLSLVSSFPHLSRAVAIDRRLLGVLSACFNAFLGVQAAETYLTFVGRAQDKVTGHPAIPPGLLPPGTARENRTRTSRRESRKEKE